MNEDPGTLRPVETEQKESFEERARRIYEDIKKQNDIRFFVVGVGNVLGVSNHSGMGADGYIYDPQKGAMVRERNEEGNLASTFDRAPSQGDEFFKDSFGRKKLSNGGVCEFLQTFIPGFSRSDSLIKDHRPRGFTVGIRVDDTKNLSVSDETLHMLRNLHTSEESKKTFASVLNMFMLDHIPEYFNLLRERRTTWKDSSLK